MCSSHTIPTTSLRRIRCHRRNGFTSWCVFLKTDRLFVFCGGRTQQQTSLCTNTYITFSVRSIHQRVPIILCNRLHVTTEFNTLKLPTVWTKIFTWTIILSKAQPSTKQPRKFKIFLKCYQKVVSN